MNFCRFQNIAKSPSQRLLRSLKTYERLHSSIQQKNVHAKLLNFADPVVSFQTKSSFELLRSVVVFKICQIKPLIARADLLLKISYRLLGQKLTNGILRLSFFDHFCAGEDELGIKPKVDYLHENGIGSILDYAAEADIGSRTTDTSVVEQRLKTDFLQARVYDYESESLCDLHAGTFKKCILAVHAVSPTGFAAIKCTALGNPILLERMSSAIVQLRTLFQELDTDKKGFISRKQFTDAYGLYFSGTPMIEDIFNKIDVDGSDSLDYVEWIDGLDFEGLHTLASYTNAQTSNPFLEVSLTLEEMELLQNMRDRIDALGLLASKLGVRLMIDAEHTYFQPAIDIISTDLIKKYNRVYPVIFSTYQMYLKDSSSRLLIDLERARKGNYSFAAKLVRGAYMVVERSRAAQMGYDDPVHDKLSHTHENYNKAMKDLILCIAAGEQVEVMIATHNRQSVELALETMSSSGLSPKSNVYFGQLLGMSDNMTFTLGNAGYKAYKYVPYGKVHEVMPYLIRRAQENSDALSGSKEELKMMTTELTRRLLTINS